jgi:hypothetical protein
MERNRLVLLASEVVAGELSWRGFGRRRSKLVERY